MLVGDLVVRIDAHALTALDVRVDRAALDRPRTDDRDLNRDVPEVLRPGAEQRLHLRPALDLEDPRRVGALNALVRGWIVIRDPAEVDLLATGPRDHLDRSLDRREHPEPEQIDLQEPRIRAGILVPLNDLASLHRRGDDRAAVDQRTGRDDHPARVLAQVARQPVGLGGEPRQPRPPSRRAAPAAEYVLNVIAHLPRVPSLAAPGHALDLPRRQPQRLAELADRAAGPVRRERRHQRRAVVAVALVDPRDQLLPDVAREVEVDVGQRGQLLVQEAADQQVVGDRIDVGQAGQEADDRRDARAATSPRRQQRTDAAGAANLERDLPGQLQQVVVKQEETRQGQALDDPKLLLQTGHGARAHRSRPLVPVVQALLAQLGELAHRGRVLGSRIAIPEIAAQVEPEPLRQRHRLRHRLRMIGKATRHHRRRGEHVAEVASPLGL